MAGMTPALGATPMAAAGMTPMATPMGGLDMATPSPSTLPSGQMTAEQYQACTAYLIFVQGTLLSFSLSSFRCTVFACYECTSRRLSADLLLFLQLLRWEREVEERNRPLSDEELDALLPTEGYKVLEPPAGYAPIRTPARKLMATPTPLGTPLYGIPEENRQQHYDVPQQLEGLPEMKPEDQQYFGKLLKEVCTQQA